MTLQLAPLFPGFPGGIELAVIVLIAILLFGANKIPKLARSTGQAMGEFQKGREEIDQELQEMRDTATGDLDGDENESEPEIGADEDNRTQTQSRTETETETRSNSGTGSGTSGNQ